MLRGDLVTLRAVEPGDHARLAGYANDLEIALLGGTGVPAPRPVASVGAEHGSVAGDDDGSVTFAINVAGDVIGQCGLYSHDPVAQTAALRIMIGDRTYWGRGYGRDAVRVLVEYGFRIRNLHKIWLTVRANNPRAIRACEAVGFVEEGRQHAQVWNGGDYVDLVYLGLLRRRRR